MGGPEEIAKSKQVLVEGKDTLNFLSAFTTHLGIAEALQLQDFGGVNELPGFLKAFRKMPGFGVVQRVGIVRDAEDDENAAQQSVRSALRNARLPQPTAIGESGSGRPTVRVLILPGGGEPGMLETVLCRSLDRPGMNRCIEEFFACADALSSDRIRRSDKARAHAYLATTRNPHHSVGAAAKAGVWPLDHEAFDGVRAFLKEL